MQEEVNEKTISLCIKGGKITAQILKAALIKLLAEMDKKKQQRNSARISGCHVILLMNVKIYLLITYYKGLLPK